MNDVAMRHAWALTFLALSLVFGEILFYYEPFLLRPGISGGHINVSKNGSEYELDHFHITCFRYKEFRHTKIQADFLAFDPLTGEMLVDVHDTIKTDWVSEDTTTITMLHGYICAASRDCEKSPLHVIYYRGEMAGNIGPYAYYNQKIYFLANELLPGTNRSRRSLVLHLMHEYKCMPYHGRPIAIFMTGEQWCSKPIATIVEWPANSSLRTGDVMYKPTAGLIAIENSGHLGFFAVIEKATVGNDTTSYVLLYIDHDDGHVTFLHEDQNSVPSRLKHSGVVCYRRGVVCWSTVQRINCGTWNYKRRAVINIRVIVTAQEVSKHGVCGTSQSLKVFAHT